MSIICETVDFPTINEVPLRPLIVKSIMINPNDTNDPGEIKSCFPSYNSRFGWKIEEVMEMTCNYFHEVKAVEEINEKTDYLFEYPKPYSKSKKLAAALIFSAMGGYVSEKKSINPNLIFGGYSSCDDSKKVDSRIGLLISDENIPTSQTQGQAFVDTKDVMKKQLRSKMLIELESFMMKDEVKKAIQIVVEKLLKAEPDNTGKVLIDGEGMEKLRLQTLNELKNCASDFDELLLKFS